MADRLLHQPYTWGMKILRQTIVFDAADLHAEAAFWAAVLDGTTQGDEEWQVVRDADGVARVGVQQSDRQRPSTWPEEPARVHFDLWVPEIGPAHEEVLRLGAQLVKPGTGDENFNVYRSPAGHLFCLCWPAG